MEQGTSDWHAARLGVLTAGTCFKTIMHGQKRGIESLLLSKIAEALTGEWQEASSASMSWGKDNEDRARMEYEFLTGNTAEEVGLIYHPDSPLIGCSPDGLIGDKGGIEIKCPHTSREHVRNLRDGFPWKEYGPQVQGCIWVTGRDWWDFVSFDPRMPPEHRIYIERIERDEKYITELAGKVNKLADELAAAITDMRTTA